MPNPNGRFISGMDMKYKIIAYGTLIGAVIINPCDVTASSSTALLCNACEDLVSRTEEYCKTAGCATETEYTIGLESVANELTSTNPFLAQILNQLIDTNGRHLFEYWFLGERPRDACEKVGMCETGEDPCPPCTDCESTDWKASVYTGYEEMVVATCDCGTCEKSTRYRCAVGYYGNPGTSHSGCTQCPIVPPIQDIPFEFGGQSNAGSTDITDCFIPSTTEYAFESTEGTYRYTENCYYTK